MKDREPAEDVSGADLRPAAYWSEQGCVILQPADMEMGAGTFHTATFLRAIGPEPWSAAYVQPSRRPTDGRYGENPIRLQHYYQFQVIIKPSPLNILDLYLGQPASARARSAGARHPLRRRQLGVADARRLGTWLGSVGERHGNHAVHLLPASGRRSSASRCPARSLTGSSVWPCTCRTSRACTTSSGPTGRSAGSPTATCSTRTRWSSPTYNFEHAERRGAVPALRRARESQQRSARAKLVLPAYEQMLKASHTFNLLDARRAISVTERQRYILRVRTLARAVAQAYYASREALGFPMLKRQQKGGSLKAAGGEVAS